MKVLGPKNTGYDPKNEGCRFPWQLPIHFRPFTPYKIHVSLVKVQDWNLTTKCSTDHHGAMISPTGPPGRYPRDVSPTVYEGISFELWG